MKQNKNFGGFFFLSENGQDFYPGYPGPGFGDFFPGQGPEMPPGMALLPPQGRGTPPLVMEHQMHPGGKKFTLND
jgi:hypothetical protein